MHNESSSLAGKTVKLIDEFDHPQFKMAGQEMIIEDWWDKISGGSWMNAEGNPACLIYAMRTGFSKCSVPMDNEVLYGKFQGMGVLVHTSEIKD